MIVYSIGIPLLGLILLFKNRKNINSLVVKLKLGFLYNGFKAKYYYWEILVMYRKIIIVGI